MQSDYAWPTLLFAVLAALSVVADRRRHHRREADRVAGRTSFIPWPLITILALIAGAVCAGLWLKGG